MIILFDTLYYVIDCFSIAMLTFIIENFFLKYNLSTSNHITN